MCESLCLIRYTTVTKNVKSVKGKERRSDFEFEVCSLKIFSYTESFYFTLIFIQVAFSTLDSGINIGVRLLFFGLFSRGYFLIREGNAYFFSKYPLFDGIGDANFKGYA